MVLHTQVLSAFNRIISSPESLLVYIPLHHCYWWSECQNLWLQLTSIVWIHLIVHFKIGVAVLLGSGVIACHIKKYSLWMPLRCHYRSVISEATFCTIYVTSESSCCTLDFHHFSFLRHWGVLLNVDHAGLPISDPDRNRKNSCILRTTNV